MRIADYFARNEAMAEAVARWDRGRDSGEGFAPEWNKIDIKGAARVLAAANDNEVDVYLLTDGREIAVANVYGPWAVDITQGG
jgi:hypothetical protein